jgi:hypothetical protein
MLCFPEGLVNVKVISGTPDTLEVKAMLPFANAASGRPDGARVTDRVSMTSAYISFDVWRTFALLHGKAGVLVAARDELLEPVRLGLEELLYFAHVSP